MSYRQRNAKQGHFDRMAGIANKEIAEGGRGQIPCVPPASFVQKWETGGFVMRWILVFLLVLFPALCFADGPHNAIAVPSGASNYGIDLGQYALCEAVYAWDADIGIEFVLKGVEVDSIGLARGTSGAFTVFCDSLNIVRTSSTAVSVLIGYPNEPCPSFAGANKVDLISPTPVAVTPAFPIFSALELIAGASTPTVFNKTHRTYPIASGMPLDGVKAVLIQLNWTKWVHGGLAIEPILDRKSVV